MSFNSLRLNHAQCELVGRGADGQPVTGAALALAGITIEGHSVVHAGHSQPIRYLGVHCCFDGSWHHQQRKSLGMIQLFTRAVTKFRVTISQAAFMFNTFLQHKLELALRYAHGAGTSDWVSKCDGLLMGAIKHAAQSPLKLSHSALALTLRINLPSWLEAAVKVSELFLRLNSTGCRWSQLGRLLWRQTMQPHVEAAPMLQRKLNVGGSRLKRAADLATHLLGWSLQLQQAERSRGRHRHLFHREPAGPLPDSNVCSHTQDLQLPNGKLVKLAHDLWPGRDACEKAACSDATAAANGPEAAAAEPAAAAAPPAEAPFALSRGTCHREPRPTTRKARERQPTSKERAASAKERRRQRQRSQRARGGGARKR